MWNHFKGDLAIYAASRIIFGLSSFVVIALLTRAMDPAEYGAYTLLFAAVTMTTIVVTSFLTNSIIRYLPLAAEGRSLRVFDYVLVQISALTVVASTLACAITLWVGHLLHFLVVTPDRLLIALALSASSAAFQIYTIHCYSLRLRRSYSYLVVAQVFIFVAGAALIPLVPVDPITAAIAFLTASYVLPLLVFRMPMPRWRRGFGRRARMTAGSFLRYGTPLIALNIAVQLNTYLDQFMLRAMRSVEEVGIYAANYVVADKVVYAISSVVALALGPLVFREWERNNHLSAYQMIWKAAIVFVALSLPVVLLMLVFPDLVMSVLTAPQYAAGRVIIPYVMIAAIFAGVSSIVSYVLSIHFRTIELALCFATCLITNFVLNVVLIPNFGVLGCAFSTIASSAVLLLALLWRVSAFEGFVGQAAHGMFSLFKRA